MFVTRVQDRPEFLAGDHTRLRELLHPARSAAAIRYSLAHGRIEAGQRSKRHRLVGSEVYYVLTGAGCFHVGDDAVTVEAGSLVYVPPGATQWVENLGSGVLDFLCVVDPAWRREDEDIEE